MRHASLAAYIMICLGSTIGCDRQVKPQPSTQDVPPAASSTNEPNIDEAKQTQVISKNSAETSKDIHGASMLLYHIEAEGVELLPDYQCVGELENPNILEAVACWHPEYGWLDPVKCVNDSYQGGTLDALDFKTSSVRTSKSRLGQPMQVCEREALKVGFSVSNLDEDAITFIYDEKSRSHDVCQYKDPLDYDASEAQDWLIARMDGSLEKTMEHWKAHVDAGVIDDCQDYFNEQKGDLSEKLEALLDDSLGAPEVLLSNPLRFPLAKQDRFQAVRSLTLPECQLDVVWGLKKEKWELLGINDSVEFTSKRPFGEGLLDVTSATCSDLNGDGSPELWFHSGYETMGGWTLMDMGEVKPGASRVLYIRYTGD